MGVRFDQPNEVLLSPISRHPVLQTHDPEFALEKLSGLGASRVQPLTHNAFFMKVDAVLLKDIVLACGYHGYGTITEYETRDYFWQAFVVRGASKQGSSSRSDVILNEKNWARLVAPGRIVFSEAHAHYQQMTIKIRKEAITSLVSALLGQGISDISFDDTLDQLSPHLRRMRRHTLALASQVNLLMRCVPVTALRELEQNILISFLLSYRHTYSELLARSEPAPSRSQLHLIEDYIGAHWKDPLDVERLAKVAGVSARSILRHFRKHRNCAPAQFVKAVRLQRAREALLSEELTNSVLAIALRCGFRSFGHFARSYRDMFGENPSDTVKQREIRHVNSLQSAIDPN